MTDDMVLRAAQGSAADRDLILKSLVPQVRAMIAARLSPTPAQFHAVEDLSQQALAGVAQGLANLRNQTIGGLRSYASVIVARRVADFLRGRPSPGARAVASLDSSLHGADVSGPLRELLSASGLSPRSSLALAEQIEGMIAQLGQLKPTHREVITLAFFDRVSMHEIAERMDMTRPAASMLLVRALKILRRAITGSSKVEDARDQEG